MKLRVLGFELTEGDIPAFPDSENVCVHNDLPFGIYVSVPLPYGVVYVQIDPEGREMNVEVYAPESDVPFSSQKLNLQELPPHNY